MDLNGHVMPALHAYPKKEEEQKVFKIVMCFAFAHVYYKLLINNINTSMASFPIAFLFKYYRKILKYPHKIYLAQRHSVAPPRNGLQ